MNIQSQRPSSHQPWEQVRTRLDQNAPFSNMHDTPYYRDAVYDHFSKQEYQRRYKALREKMREHKLEVAWTATTGPGKAPWFGGAGWTGQPAIVQWPDVMRHSMTRLGPRRFEKGFVEVIQGSLDGSVHFLDLRTGRPTRPPT